jgi:hypothetical protein
MSVGAQMTDQQLYLAIGVPILFNGIAMTLLSSRISDLAVNLRREMDSLRREMDMQFKVVLEKLGELDTRITRLEERR